MVGGDRIPGLSDRHSGLRRLSVSLLHERQEQVEERRRGRKGELGDEARLFHAGGCPGGIA